MLIGLFTVVDGLGLSGMGNREKEKDFIGACQVWETGRERILSEEVEFHISREIRIDLQNSYFLTCYVSVISR